ncbi:hypothetical protein FHR33_001711 [Nonomuraea dietziae]|uniref:Uncharacterized protein n=1 Tax=Nonomuraea dietziae TaxID=65515 RepID=A0A7W5UW78_9ACTN|nr:hypothetical protein [Nonomuraea dietziae]
MSVTFTPVTARTSGRGGRERCTSMHFVQGVGCGGVTPQLWLAVLSVPPSGARRAYNQCAELVLSGEHTVRAASRPKA